MFDLLPSFGQTEGSDAGDTERLEELPLCSCRMEAPRVDSTSHRVSRQCMATESINGEVCIHSFFSFFLFFLQFLKARSLTLPCSLSQLRACTSRTIKGETMRPSSRVPLMVLCDVHRSHMVKHHCCPGCGYFCIAVRVYILFLKPFLVTTCFFLFILRFFFNFSTVKIGIACLTKSKISFFLSWTKETRKN